MSEPVTIPVQFELVSIAPDARPYKPGGPPILQPNGSVTFQINVPVSDHCINWEEIIKGQLDAATIKPIFKPSALKFMLEQFEAVLRYEEDLSTLEDWDAEEKPKEPESKSDDWNEDEDDFTDAPGSDELEEDEWESKS